MPWGGNERLWEAMKGTDANAARQQNRFKLLYWRPALTSAAGARYSSGFYKRNTNPQKTGLGEPRGSVHPFPRGLSPWAAPDGGVLDLRTSGDGASCAGATAGGQRIVRLLVGWWWWWVFYN